MLSSTFYNFFCDLLCKFTKLCLSDNFIRISLGRWFVNKFFVFSSFFLIKGKSVRILQEMLEHFKQFQRQKKNWHSFKHTIAGNECQFFFYTIYISNLSFEISGQELTGAFLGRVFEDFLGSAVFGDYTIVHEEDFVGDVTGELHFVGDDDHGGMLVGEAADDFQDFAGQLGVEG